jgi:hypothetical protein
VHLVIFWVVPLELICLLPPPPTNILRNLTRQRISEKDHQSSSAFVMQMQFRKAISRSRLTWRYTHIPYRIIYKKSKSFSFFRIRLRMKSELAMGARLARPSRAHVSDRGSGGGPRWWRRLKLDADARGRGKSPPHLPSKYTSQGGGGRGQGRIEIE